ncbi:MAG: SDR family NAD(P)-dependent oxidoreductase [Pseudolabrys sp.]
MSPAEPLALITGASSGIGAALAREFARRGHALALTARRAAALEALAESIAAEGHPRPHVIASDLGTPSGVAQLAETIAARGLAPAFLVNNAGFGLMGEAADLDSARQLAMVDLNMRALTDLSLRLLDSVRAARGGILNVASVAGFLPGPGMAVYHASKAYVLSFTEALHAELKAEGVRVCALCPGPVKTAFFQHAGVPDAHFPSYFLRAPERVARQGYEGFMAGHRVVVPGKPNRMVTLTARVLPRGLMLALSERHWKRAGGG